MVGLLKFMHLAFEDYYLEMILIFTKEPARFLAKKYFPFIHQIKDFLSIRMMSGGRINGIR